MKFNPKDILMKKRMNICIVDLRHAQTTKTTTNQTKTIQDYLGGSSGIITLVRVNELIPRECLCMLYAQRVNLFGMRKVLCSYLRLISRSC